MKTVFAFIFSIFSVICLAQGNGYLGISMKTLQNGGVRISDVLQNGAAETYGMFQNDVILSIDGIKVNSNV
ncbi:MAG: PDZ domain-containing protein, partial [Flavobacteriales bacterium]